MEPHLKNFDVVKDISGEGDPEITEIESLCLQCNLEGTTRLLLTRIPHFREVIVSSFSCANCGNSNSELQPAKRIEDTGIKYTVRVLEEKDLNRSVVITNRASITIPELDFEIPPNRGSLTTIEGLLSKAISDLLQHQAQRRIENEVLADQIESFVGKLKELTTGQKTFTLELDDISGNSYVENPFAPAVDPNVTICKYKRTREQDEQLGIFSTDEEVAPTDVDVREEVLSIPSNCPSCNAPCPVQMKALDIPNFKEVIIMATTCDLCGYRSNEVKSGAAISPRGSRISLVINEQADLKRDILKSDTSGVRIPELEFETHISTLGGRFTTVEGLLVNIRDNLSEANPFVFGDSSNRDKRDKLTEFCTRIDEIIDGKRVGVTLELDDPAGNSYIQNIYEPDPDPHLTVVEYERTYEQNDILGLNDMRTENYQNDFSSNT